MHIMHNSKTEQDAEIRYQNRSSITQNHVKSSKYSLNYYGSTILTSKFKNDSTKKLSLKVVRTFYSKYREGKYSPLCKVLPPKCTAKSYLFLRLIL